jgi:hypothetical protein
MPKTDPSALDSLGFSVAYGCRVGSYGFPLPGLSLLRIRFKNKAIAAP